MDFVENYFCQFCDEVQSMYWNRVMVSFYFVVVYFKDVDGYLKYKSFVFVFDELFYNLLLIYLIFKKFLFQLKGLVILLICIYYWIDSFILQY